MRNRRSKFALAWAVLILIAATSFAGAQDVRDLIVTVDDDTASRFCAVSPDALDDGELCKVSDATSSIPNLAPFDRTTGSRPVALVADTCADTLYIGDARGPAGDRTGGIRVVRNWFPPDFNAGPVTGFSDVLVRNPHPEQAGLNGLTAVGLNRAGERVFLTGDRFTGRLYRVTIAEDDSSVWDIITQTPARPTATCDRDNPPGMPGSTCIGAGINNLELDNQGRIWIPVSTARGPGGVALGEERRDGFIMMVKINGGLKNLLNLPRGGLRGAARSTLFFAGEGEGFFLANGLRLDPQGEYVYMAETVSETPRVVRMKIMKQRGKTTLGEPETYVEFPKNTLFWGNSNPGPDEIAFDEDGNLYIVLVFANALVVVPHDAADDADTIREVHTVFQAANVAAMETFTLKLEGSEPIVGSDFGPLTALGPFTNNPVGISFGGPDRMRIFVNSRGTDTHTFMGLVPGVTGAISFCQSRRE